MAHEKYSKEQINIEGIQDKDYYWLLYLKNQKHIRIAESELRPFYSEDFLKEVIKKIREEQKKEEQDKRRDYFYIIKLNGLYIDTRYIKKENRIGYVRVRRKKGDSKWCIGVGVDRNCLGKDVAYIAVDKLFEEHKEIEEFFANIDEENLASLRLFGDKLKFQKVSENDNFLVYHKENQYFEKDVPPPSCL
jgi:RimJ/RimL family protein N-acetyltransferase